MKALQYYSSGLHNFFKKSGILVQCALFVYVDILR